MPRAHKNTKSLHFTKVKYTWHEVEKIIEEVLVKVDKNHANKIASLKEEYESKIKVLEESKLSRPRGRPKINKVKLGWFSSLMSGVIKKKIGRPISYKNAHEKIQEWDNGRESLAKEKGWKRCLDKDLIKHICDNDKAASEHKKRAQAKELAKVIKSMRDKTGIRIHRRTKAENPT